MRDIRELSRRKRHGGELSAEELGWIVEEYTAGGIEDAPMAAWLMAVCWAGMTEAETWALTEAMMRSGEVVDLSGMERPTVVLPHPLGAAPIIQVMRPPGPSMPVMNMCSATWSPFFS